MNELFRAKRNEFIERSFRDIADCDYIAARVCARLKLRDQFLWFSLQALEKYLKAIILFHDGDTRKVGHDLIEATKIIEKIPDVPLKLPPSIFDFLEYLTRYGGDRYFVSPRGSFGDELFKLDDVVWSVRRFCEDLYWLEQVSSEKGKDWCKARLAYLISPECKQNAVRFRLKQKGYLEDVLDTKKYLNQREQLVWKNFRFGARKKNRIIHQKTITGETPAHYLYPELSTWVEEHVRLPRDNKKSGGEAVTITEAEDGNSK